MHTQQMLFLLAAAGTTFIEARPSSTSSTSPAPRQVNGGSFECNTARVRIVAGLQETRTNVNQIVDVTTRGTANEGINLASNAINSIAIAVFTGVVPPADARKITEGGSTSDPAVGLAQASFAEAVAAAFDVVDLCT
ncbi:hypothetical protein PG984_010033 [Apiospora sp. TS-2023a]